MRTLEGVEFILCNPTFQESYVIAKLHLKNSFCELLVHSVVWPILNKTRILHFDATVVHHFVSFMVCLTVLGYSEIFKTTIYAEKGNLSDFRIFRIAL